MLERPFNADMLYNRIVRFYMDKRGYKKEDANRIAQAVVQKEAERRTCKYGGCGHLMHEHARNAGACGKQGCSCMEFARG